MNYTQKPKYRHCRAVYLRATKLVDFDSPLKNSEKLKYSRIFTKYYSVYFQVLEDACNNFEERNKGDKRQEIYFKYIEWLSKKVRYSWRIVFFSSGASYRWYLGLIIRPFYGQLHMTFKYGPASFGGSLV
ncbi:hypothetical protein [Chitinophaga sp.]|uniref:hypothetical protein n=1 Tax=Chitinophaga sp. TaxID=1869181 RepID=UPI0031D83FBF